MANTIFTGFFIDENNNKISNDAVRYFGIHRDTQGVLRVSDTRVAEVDMYNFNLIDADWLGNSIPFIDGDQVAIVAWQDQSEDKLSNNLARFGMIFFPQDGRDTYVQNIQLLPKQNPVCNLEVTGDKVGEEIIAKANASDMFQWEFEGMTHYHRESIFGYTISRVGDITVEYDFGDGWQVSNKHTFTTAGDYSIKTRVTNAFGGVAMCDKTYSIVNNAPEGCITFSDTQPVIYDVILVTACIQDPSGVIVNVEHYWDDTLIDSNTDLSYEYTVPLNVNKTYTAKQVITWYDGFKNQTVTFEKELTMANLPPEFDLIDTLLNEEQTVSTYEFIMDNLRDPDGDDAKVNTKWKIEFETPIDNLFKTVYDPGYNADINQDPVTFDFNVTGDYRITATAIDELGAETTKTTIITVVAQDCPDDVVQPEPEEFVRWIEWE